VNAVREGQPTEELIPVNVAPTEEWAKELEGRLRFLEGAILSRYEADLKACAE
jgi:hypothetical protein